MPNATFELDRIVPISDFSRGKATRIFAKAQDGIPLVVVRNNKPTAVITSTDEFQRLTEIEENYILLSQALKRESERDASKDLSFEQLCEQYGLSEAEISAADYVELYE